MSFHSLTAQFFLAPNDHSIVWPYHSFSIHLRGCFQIWAAVMSKAARRAAFCGDLFSTPLGKNQKAGLLARMIRVTFSFVRNCQTFTKWLRRFAFPLGIIESSCLSTSLPALVSVFWIWALLIVVISRCCFVLFFGAVLSGLWDLISPTRG